MENLKIVLADEADVDFLLLNKGEENVWIYVKNTDTEKREFYHASLACLAHYVLLKIKKYILS
ncbi:TPA: hypothetical protein I1795_002342 [Staphylococcus pseudintermedius]|nr:hypothetical protein [Staphylococcus pseudintermedius]MDK3720197.1 hypothetical protein [Staphylococcus pseudintermedius]MDK4033765.1 hypothetical protein [Staphylococcus pseudintermedius]MDK4074233.1 hypothetical protein [Staphylococcus pseudintermedius]HAR6393279.1 hypothetical protein [Staphylococcus pseudintermedius]